MGSGATFIPREFNAAREDMSRQRQDSRDKEPRETLTMIAKPPVSAATASGSNISISTPSLRLDVGLRHLQVGQPLGRAARKLKLDFIPLFVEDYYLLGKRETVERADIETIVEVIKSDEFVALVKEILGYDTSHIGELTN